ncbi:MAG: SCP2 sterol-binding domain-containing protein [Actinomycetia bacterium]|nr:SCP2 sterol-binding domain-containing protein [Actinomycetes bacterium]
MQEPDPEPDERPEAQPEGSPSTSQEYFDRLLAEASRADPGAMQRAAASLAGRLVHVVVETEEEDESFCVVHDDGSIRTSIREQQEPAAVTVRITPAVMRDILQGELTPVEAFFMGKLRARGTTRSLYAFQQFFIGVAQIGASSPVILDLIDDFEQRKG